MLTKDRNTPRAAGEDRGHPVAAEAVIFAGALVCLNAAGFAVPGDEDADLLTIGRAEERVDNSSGANGDAVVLARLGIFRWDNSASADEITRADIGKPAYVVDDHTVAKTSDSGGRSIAGFVDDVDELGVWVRIDPALARAHAELSAAIDALGD